MLRDSEDRRALDVVVVVGAAVALVAGRVLWAHEAAPWWSPFGLWALLVGIGALRAFTNGDA